MIDVSPAELPAYFEAVHGSPPFPWQGRLLHDIVDRGGGPWPDLLDRRPARKTTTVDQAGSRVLFRD